MNCLKNKEIIQAYIDNELDKGNEINLFDHLSGCPDCRAYFKSLTTISANIDRQEYPEGLDERILYSVKEKESKRLNRFLTSKFMPAFSYAVAAILIVVSIILFSQINSYKNEIASVNKKIVQQNHTIELLYNSYPPAEVTGKNPYTVVVKAKKL